MSAESAVNVPQPQLVLADLDGTLIVEPRGIGRGAVDLINFAAATGGTVVPVSARSITHLARMFCPYPQVVWAVGSGGAVTARLSGSGENYSVLHEETLVASEGPDFMADLHELQRRGHGLIFLFHGSDSVFKVGVVGNSSELGQSNLAVIVGDRPMRPTDDLLHPYRLLGVSLLTPLAPERLRAFLNTKTLPDAWRASAYPEYRVPGWSWLEIFPKSANKAEACRRVVQVWSNESGTNPVITALGDAPDDIGMLNVADRSYCPSTASHDVQLAASEVLRQPGGDEFAEAVAARLQTSACVRP